MGRPSAVAELAAADLRRQALHEGAHAAAAYLLGRPLRTVRICAAGGHTEAGIVPSDRALTLEDVRDGIAILLAADAATCGPPSVPEDDNDEAQALGLACQVAEDHREIAAVVALGRARAKVLAMRGDFGEMTGAVAALLLDRRELPGEAVVAECERIAARRGRTVVVLAARC
jgi:hypothetical protein